MASCPRTSAGCGQLIDYLPACQASYVGARCLLHLSIKMVQRADRLANFNTDSDPAPDTMVQVLCQDHVGTYLLPFLCSMTDRGWVNAATFLPIQTDVIGWRLASLRTAHHNRRWEPHRPTNRG